MKTSSKNTTSRHKHHSYFDRQPDAWNIETFIKAIYPAIIGGQRPPPEPSACPDWMQRLQRTIFRSWANNLGNISSCQHCHHPRRKRADVLLSDFNKQNSRLSDRSSAKSILQELIDKHPPVYVTFGPTIVNSIVNNGNGNVNSQSFGNGVADQSPNEPSSGDDSADVATSRSKSKSQRDAEFRQAYYSFLDDCKWVLPSGDTVEDTFFKAYFAKSTPPQVRNAIGNWTLLVGDSDMQDLFHPDDWPAILARVKPLPSLDLEIAEELVQRFGSVTSTAQLVQVLQNCPPIDMQAPNASDRRWVRRVLHHFLELHLQQKFSNITDVKERWFDVNIWGPIIDGCMISLPGVHLNRSELVSQAYVLRKNRNRTDQSGRLQTGPKVDGLFHAVNNRGIEFGIIESAPRLSGGETSSKWLGDKTKMRKIMRDIFVQLAIEAKHDPRVVKDLEVVAYTTAGMKMQVLRMVRPTGYVLVVTEDQPVTVPQEITQFSELLLVLGLVLKSKAALTRSVAAFQTRFTGNEEALLDALLNVGEVPDRDGSQLPFSADTP